MTHLMIAGGIYLLLLALIIIFNPLTRGGKERMWESSTKASRNTDACTGAWA